MNETSNLLQKAASSIDRVDNLQAAYDFIQGMGEHAQFKVGRIAHLEISIDKEAVLGSVQRQIDEAKRVRSQWRAKAAEALQGATCDD